jgi:hypothetical protein
VRGSVKPHKGGSPCRPGPDSPGGEGHSRQGETPEQRYRDEAWWPGLTVRDGDVTLQGMHGRMVTWEGVRAADDED